MKADYSHSVFIHPSSKLIDKLGFRCFPSQSVQICFSYVYFCAYYKLGYSFKSISCAKSNIIIEFTPKIIPKEGGTIEGATIPQLCLCHFTILSIIHNNHPQ